MNVVSALARKDFGPPEDPDAGERCLACIDIGTNTTRLLVAELGGGAVTRELATQRAYTRIGSNLGPGGLIPAWKIAEVAEVVATQARQALELGAADVIVVATAAVRNAPNRDELVAAVEREAGIVVRVLSGSEEARLSFLGATRALDDPDARVAVVDVGGGSTEIAIGTRREGATWDITYAIGSASLHEFENDPPSQEELNAARKRVIEFFADLELEHPDRAIAIAGTASSLRRVVGAELDHETLARAIRVLTTNPSDEVAQRFHLDPDRVRLLPAGALILDGLLDRLGVPLHVGAGGLRDGVLIEAALV